MKDKVLHNQPSFLRWGFDLSWLVPSHVTLWLAAAAFFMSPMSGVRVGASMSVGDMLFAVAVAVAFLERLAMKEQIRFFRVYLIGGFLIMLSFVANELFPDALNASEHVQFIESFTSNGIVPDMSQYPFFRVFLSSVVIFPQAFLIFRIENREDLKTILYFWTAGAIYGAIYTVAFCNGFVSGKVDYFWNINHRAAGLTLHPNALALGCVLAFPGLFLMFLDSKNLLVRCFVVFLALIVLDAINYSGSRTAIYTFVFMLGTIFALVYPQISQAARVRAFVLLALIVVSYFLYRGLSGPVDTDSALGRLDTGASESDGLRNFDQDTAWRGFWQDPIFGKGYEWLRLAHNVYLQVMHSAGLVGLAGYLMILLFPIYNAVQNWGRLQAPEDRLLLKVLLTGALGVLLWGWAQPNINALNPTIPFGLLLVLSVMMIKPKGAVPASMSSVVRV